MEYRNIEMKVHGVHECYAIKDANPIFCTKPLPRSNICEGQTFFYEKGETSMYTL